MMRLGAMRHVVKIQKQSTAQDSTGQNVLAWTTFAERRAAVQRTPGNEVFASAVRNGRVPTVFRLRYLTGVSPAMRIVMDDKVYNIISAADPSGTGEELVITAEELVAEAP